MASMMKKAMIYLGLGPDEEYEQYEDYAAPAPASGAGDHVRATGPQPQSGPRLAARPESDQGSTVRPQATSGTVRPITAEPRPDTAGYGMQSRVEPEPIPTSVRTHASSAVRTVGPANPMPHAVSPTSFNDAQEIGDRFKAGQPVIVNLQAVDRDLRRRLVDFASGLCYAIAGRMKRVADQVYLLTPPDVEVPAEETQRHLDS